MNTITKPEPPPLEPKPQTGAIYENSCGTYLLGEFNRQYFLVNLESGSTWSGFQRYIEDVFGDSDFRLVDYSIVLTPEHPRL